MLAPRALLVRVAGILVPAQLPRMCHPVTGRPLQALVLADVDLEDGTVRRRPGAHRHATPPDGVHAVGWLHGVPVGEATYVGDVDHLLTELAGPLRERLAPAVQEHRLLDAIGTPGGVTRAERDGLAAVRHPPVERSGRPSVSVVICTRDRPDDLRGALAGLSELRGPVHEILVVDNAPSTEATREVVAAFAGVRYIREPRPGLDWARNRALLEAAGEVIAYTDDDVVVHPGWLDGLLTALVDEPAAVGVTGLVLPVELSTPAQVMFELYAGFGRGYRPQWFASNVAAGDVAVQDFGASGLAGTGANMAFRRRPLIDLGGFDPAMDVGTLTGGGGDLEIYYRVVAAGHLLVYEPSAVVFHRHRRDWEGLVRQLHGYGTGSYCFWLGAGARYGAAQRREFRRLALRWARNRHLKQHLRSLLRPDTVPSDLARSETRGMIECVAGRLYDRADAVARAHRSWDEPTVAPVVRPSDRPRVPHAPVPVVRVDLAAPDPLAGVDVPVSTAPAVSIDVRRGDVAVSLLQVATRGSGASRRRVAHEVVAALGVEVLPAGLSWPGNDRSPGSEPAPRWDGSAAAEMFPAGTTH